MAFRTRTWLIAKLVRKTRSFRQSDHGAVLIETAIIFPLLLVFLLGTFELGRAFYARHTLEKAVRVSARYLARVDPGNYAEAVTIANQLALAELQMAGITSGDATVTPPSTLDQPTVVYSASAEMEFPLLGFLGIVKSITLRASHEQPYIGQ